MAYLGGDLVYRQRIGVTHAEGSLPQEFTPFLDSAALPENAMVRARAADTDALSVRERGRVCALVHACGGPLSEGTLKDGWSSVRGMHPSLRLTRAASWMVRRRTTSRTGRRLGWPQVVPGDDVVAQKSRALWLGRPAPLDYRGPAHGCRTLAAGRRARWTSIFCSTACPGQALRNQRHDAPLA